MSNYLKCLCNFMAVLIMMSPLNRSTIVISNRGRNCHYGSRTFSLTGSGSLNYTYSKHKIQAKATTNLVPSFFLSLFFPSLFYSFSTFWFSKSSLHPTNYCSCPSLFYSSSSSYSLVESWKVAR